MISGQEYHFPNGPIAGNALLIFSEDTPAPAGAQGSSAAALELGLPFIHRADRLPPVCRHICYLRTQL